MVRDSACPSSLINCIRPVLEGLEERRLLAASLADGILTVDGTNNNDKILVSMNKAGSRYTVNVAGDAQNFNAADVNRIVINGLGGNDTIRFDEDASRIDVNTVINGGDGNDRITGSSRKDNVRGGAGRDFILGGQGHDRLAGGVDDDTIFGDAGNDRLFGEDGDDVMGGDDEGALVIRGERIPNQVTGDDSLDGGAGNDWMLGGVRHELGQDDQQPPNNVVLLIEDDDTDTFTGGTGNDIIDARGADDVITDLADADTVPSREIRAGSQTNNHIHVQLNIRVRNGDTVERVVVPHRIGQFEQGVDAVHTHDQAGEIHYEAADDDPYTIGEFLENWGIAVDGRVFGRTQSNAKSPVRVKVNPDVGDSQTLSLSDLRGYEPEDGDIITITIG